MNPIQMRDHEKIFEGSYQYVEDGKVYSEENFGIFRPFAKDYFVFKSEILTRCSNGEFLKISTQYKVNQEFFPLEVIINRTMGVKNVTETFFPLGKEQKLKYIFKTKEETREEEVKMPINKYHIATPSSACALLFVTSKKYDPTKRNSYSMVISENIWTFEKKPRQSYVFLESENHIHTGEQELKIGSNTRLARKYLFFEKMKTEDVHKKVSQDQAERPVVFYVSEHFNIPYLIEINENTKIEVKMLRNLQNHEIENIVKNI